MNLDQSPKYRVRPSCGGYVVEIGHFTPDDEGLPLKTLGWFKEYGEADEVRHRLETGG